MDACTLYPVKELATNLRPGAPHPSTLEGNTKSDKEKEGGVTRASAGGSYLQTDKHHA